MSKGLEALKDIRDTYIDSYYGVSRCEIIEKELRALEIIRNKDVNVFLFKECCANKWKMPYSYNQSFNKRKQLTQEEYNLLKEVTL